MMMMKALQYSRKSVILYEDDINLNEMIVGNVRRLPNAATFSLLFSPFFRRIRRSSFFSCYWLNYIYIHADNKQTHTHTHTFTQNPCWSQGIYSFLSCLSKIDFYTTNTATTTNRNLNYNSLFYAIEMK